MGGARGRELRRPAGRALPCLLDAVHDAGGAGEQLVLIGHAARADPVVPELFSGQEVLLVFQGPNGYISPAWYGEGPSPPTWNFTAVHVRGIPEVLQGGEAFSVLERTVEHFEAARDDPWELRGEALVYARRLAHEMAPFRVRSAAIQAKAKLSQDKPPRIQDRVIAALEAGGPYRKRRSSGLSKTSYRSLCRAAARSCNRRAAVRVGKGRT
jgi:predicted FMN-binding regulatory protein PaiB